MVSAPGCPLLHGETHAKGVRRALFALLPPILWPQPFTPLPNRLLEFYIVSDHLRSKYRTSRTVHQKMYTYRYLHPRHTCITLRKLKRRACHLRALIGALLGKSNFGFNSAFQPFKTSPNGYNKMGNRPCQHREHRASKVNSFASKTFLMSGFTKIHTHRLLSNQRCRDRESLFWLTEARPRVFLGLSLGSAFPRRRHMWAGRRGEFSSANNPKSRKTFSSALHTACTSPGFPPCARSGAHAISLIIS